MVARRNLLAGTLGAVAGAGATGLAFALVDDGAAQPGVPHAAGGDVEPVPAAGPTQAGIDRPATPQSHGLLHVYDLDDPSELDFLGPLGDRIIELTDPASREPEVRAILPDGPGDLTVTVGLGPRPMRARRPDGPGTEDLPRFAGDDGIDSSRLGGDLLIATYATDAGAVSPAQDHLERLLPHARLRWSQRLFRSPGAGTVTRNPLGFHDGIIVPHTDEELAENVYLAQPAGTTVCVIRRLRLDAARFRAESIPHQEAVIGRRQPDGAPLSGGKQSDQVDLSAKTPEGQYLVPARAHARAAHPSFTGSRLMLRRGYGFDDGDGDAGLMFICFQQDLRTFTETQRRLDEVDDLMEYVTPTGSATFLILPGFHAGAPLGRS